MRKVLGNWLQQFTCPECGHIGAGSPLLLPLCHICNGGVKMLPSNNGRIYPDWEITHSRNIAEVESDPDR